MITRFAPSPTGALHLGHAYSAMLAHDMARAAGGKFLLRIDDIDQGRARPEWEALIDQDLRWLGLRWPVPPRRQSAHLADYRAALDRLSALGLTYPCRCSRRDIQAAASAPQEGAAPLGPDGRVYPGTCRGRAMSDWRPGDAIRLNMAKALTIKPLAYFVETGPARAGRHALDAEYMIEQVGDVVLARRDHGASYHLSVVVDDAAQTVSQVIRGQDLFAATYIHVLLQTLLGLAQPSYHHHRLIRDATGKRLAKRDDARAISKYRAQGATPDDIRRMVGLERPYSR
jgi:glutamyl-Q tRNA(Asp) synthetase